MSLQVVKLEHFALEEREVEQALARVNVRAVDYADIYFESTISESVSMEEGIVKRAVKSISQGAGVRATSGKKPGLPIPTNCRNGIWKSPRILHGISPTPRKATFRSPSRIVPRDAQSLSS